MDPLAFTFLILMCLVVLFASMVVTSQFQVRRLRREANTLQSQLTSMFETNDEMRKANMSLYETNQSLMTTIYEYLKAKQDYETILYTAPRKVEPSKGSPGASGGVPYPVQGGDGQ